MNSYKSAIWKAIKEILDTSGIEFTCILFSGFPDEVRVNSSSIFPRVEKRKNSIYLHLLGSSDGGASTCICTYLATGSGETEEMLKKVCSVAADIMFSIEQTKSLFCFKPYLEAAVIEAVAKGKHKYRFTFGSSSKYPYQLGHVLVLADTLTDASIAFSREYPNSAGEDTLNCSFCYTDSEWDGMEVYESMLKCHDIIFA